MYKVYTRKFDYNQIDPNTFMPMLENNIEMKEPYYHSPSLEDVLQVASGISIMFRIPTLIFDSQNNLIYTTTDYDPNIIN